MSKARYSSSQICELNSISICKWRGKRIIALQRISFLRKCLDNSVTPKDIYEKVKKLRPRFAASIARAFIKNEIAEERDKLVSLSSSYNSTWRKASRFLAFFDWIRFNKLLGENGCRLRCKLRSDYAGKIHWLRNQRFGSEDLNTASVFNLSQHELSRPQLEVLSRGPRFGIPPSSICKEEILSEFEIYYDGELVAKTVGAGETRCFQDKLGQLSTRV